MLGFGAVILQFAAHVAVIKLTKWIVTQIVEIVNNKPSTKTTEFYNLDSSIGRPSSVNGTRGTGTDGGLDSNTISRSISSLSVE